MGILFEHVVPDPARQVIGKLPDRLLNAFYLAGGTGLALQIGHRYSDDFDFFTPDAFDTDALKAGIRAAGAFKVFQESPGTLEGRVDGTRLFFCHYPYPLIAGTEDWGRVRLASVVDIALMKLSAIAGRGNRKDFVDLYFLKDRIGWEELFSLFEKKFRGSGENMYHIVKSFTYFDDARKEPMPKMIVECHWERVEDYFTDLQKKAAKMFLSR